MALTQAEKEKIVRYFGYPTDTLRKDSIFYNSYIDTFYLKNLTDESETEIRTFLERIAEIDKQIREAPKRLKASAVGTEIQLNAREISQLRDERYSVIYELRSMLRF